MTGWWFQPLWKIVSWGDYSQYMESHNPFHGSWHHQADHHWYYHHPIIISSLISLRSLVSYITSTNQLVMIQTIGKVINLCSWHHLAQMMIPSTTQWHFGQPETSMAWHLGAGYGLPQLGSQLHHERSELTHAWHCRDEWGNIMGC